MLQLISNSKLVRSNMIRLGRSIRSSEYESDSNRLRISLARRRFTRRFSSLWFAHARGASDIGEALALFAHLHDAFCFPLQTLNPCIDFCLISILGHTLAFFVRSASLFAFILHVERRFFFLKCNLCFVLQTDCFVCFGLFDQIVFIQSTDPNTHTHTNIQTSEQSQFSKHFFNFARLTRLRLFIALN